MLNEDFYLLTRMLTRTEGIYSLPGYGYHVYYRIGSNTRKKDPDVFPRVYGDCVDNADRVTALVEEYYPALQRWQSVSGCSRGWNICFTFRWDR